MEKIKKQFIAFWQYFRLLQRGAGNMEAGRRLRKYLLPFILVCVMIVVTSSQMNLDFTIFEGVIIGAGMGVGITTAIKPSALSVAPFSPRQRMVFTFLSALLIALMAFAFIFAFTTLFVLIIAFIAFCVDGTNIFASASSAETYSAYGHAFSILTFAFFFFVTYAIFHLERKRNVAIASAVLLAVMEIFTLVMTNLCGNAEYPPFEATILPVSKFHFCGYADVRARIVNLYAPWAPILVLAIMNALAIAAAVFLTIRRFKSDKV